MFYFFGCKHAQMLTRKKADEFSWGVIRIRIGTKADNLYQPRRPI